MQVYLVGGAVRDALLGYPVKERDWVVVGSTKNDLVKQGFIQVGRDFPVFLHPKTKEEYALARTERKAAPGYYGFDCDYSQSVTLEEDLQRRDLTINAIAQDGEGHIIDPYQGQADLKAKILRHVSPAFVEDPVRVLRVARFAARYHHLGFQVADETLSLIYEMGKLGEVDNLIPERVCQELLSSLAERNPEVFFETLRSTGTLALIFPEIDALFGVPNPPKYHPEIDSGIHTLLVLKAAAKLSTDPLIRFAALVHDLGKALTPMTTWPKHPEHETLGLKPIERLCDRLRIPSEFKELALLCCRLHLKIHRLFELRASTVVKVLEQADAFRRPQRFHNLLTVSEADAYGIGGERAHYEQANVWQLLLDICSKVSVQTIMDQGFKGAVIKDKLHEQRVSCVEEQVQSWKKIK